jgi:HlyD family secretion protein
MKNTQIIGTALIAVMLLTACNSNSDKADGYGNFEATEITVSAENTGKLMDFQVDEGVVLEQNAFVGYVDTIPLYLKKEQLFVQKNLISAKSKGVLSQINVLQAQLQTAKINKTRIENLIKDNAGTQKQLDDIKGEIAIINNQIRSVEIQNAPVVNELKGIDVQLAQLNDQITKSKIINPIKGTILSKYSESGEIVSFGKPLYKIADLSLMELRVYISETQLPNIKIGQEVSIKIDNQDGMKSFNGTVSWIASEAEFTPKIIQTKEERVALVYAAKVQVKNDGSLKIGMPAEMWLNINN